MLSTLHGLPDGLTLQSLSPLNCPLLPAEEKHTEGRRSQRWPRRSTFNRRAAKSELIAVWKVTVDQKRHFLCEMKCLGLPGNLGGRETPFVAVD